MIQIQREAWEIDGARMCDVYQRAVEIIAATTPKGSNGGMLHKHVADPSELGPALLIKLHTEDVQTYAVPVARLDSKEENLY